MPWQLWRVQAAFGAVRVVIRWQVVQRSRTWHGSTTSFSELTCHTSPASGFSCWDRSVTFVSILVSLVSNSHSIVAAASTSSVLGSAAHFFSRAWTAEAPRWAIRPRA